MCADYDVHSLGANKFLHYLTFANYTLSGVHKMAVTEETVLY